MKKIAATKSTQQNNELIKKLVDLELALKKMPDLADVDRAKLNQDIALGHLYYSSRIEGTKLNNKQIEKAIYGKEGLVSA